MNKGNQMSYKKYLPFVLLLFILFPMTSPAVQTGEKLKHFVHRDMDGNVVDMSNIIGKKPVMLVFWASWCPNCKTEVPKVNKLVAEYEEQGMEFIAINIGYNDSPKRARKFMEKTAMNYPVIFDSTSTITSGYMIYGVPTILVADSDGVVRFRNFGTPDITQDNFKRLQGEE